MANVPKKLYRGSPTTTLATAYTVPASTTTIVTNIVVSNTTSTPISMLIRFGGQSIVPNTPIPATGFLTLDISQVLDATDKIEIQASAAGVSLFVSGVEVTA